MTRAVHVPYTVEQDDDGVWCAHAQLRPGVGANGVPIEPASATPPSLSAWRPTWDRPPPGAVRPSERG